MTDKMIHRLIFAPHNNKKRDAAQLRWLSKCSWNIFCKKFKRAGARDDRTREEL